MPEINLVSERWVSTVQYKEFKGNGRFEAAEEGSGIGNAEEEELGDPL